MTSIDVSATMRQVQIDMITGRPNQYIDRFNSLCQNISIITDDIYHTNGGEHIYYSQNEEWIFYQDQTNNRFWYNYYYWIYGMIKNNDLNEVCATRILRILIDDIFVQKFKASSKADVKGNLASELITEKMRAGINFPNNKRIIYNKLDDILKY